MSTVSAAVGFIIEFLSNVSGWRRWAVAFVAGVSAALAMSPFYFLPLLVAGFTTFVILIDGAEKSERPRRSAFIVGWWFGFGYFLLGIYWMAFSFFVQADEFAWMAPFAVTGLPAFLAVFTGAAAAIARALWPNGWRRVVLFVVVFASFEYLRGHILTGLPWNLTGQALAGGAVWAQTAAWYGAYGLSFVAIFLSVLPVLGIKYTEGKFDWKTGLIPTIVGFSTLLLIGWIRLVDVQVDDQTSIVLRIVQPNIPQKEKIDPSFWAANFNNQLSLSKGAPPNGESMIVVWPENGVPLLDESPRGLGILGTSMPIDSTLVAGSVRRTKNKDGLQNFYNSIAIAAKENEKFLVTSHYDKHHLVPFGEYLPFYGLLNAIGLAQLTPYGDAGFASGEGPATYTIAGAEFALLICYEAIFPGEMYPKGERPDGLITVTNDAWFGDSSGPRQHLDQARLRSIESGLPMARSANTGISAVIDAKGRILERIPLYERGRIDMPLPRKLPRPIFDYVGDWLFAVMCAAGLFISLFRKK